MVSDVGWGGVPAGLVSAGCILLAFWSVSCEAFTGGNTCWFRSDTHAPLFWRLLSTVSSTRGFHKEDVMLFFSPEVFRVWGEMEESTSSPFQS